MTRRQWNTGLMGISVHLLAGVLPAQQTPRQSPEFTALTPGGRPLRISEHRGKVLAIEFLLTECPHCQETAQLLERLQKEYGPRGFQAIGVAFNADGPSRLPALIKRLNLSFPIGTASQLSVFQYLQLSFARRYSVPFLAFVDRAGIIRTQFTGDDSIFKNAEVGLRSNIEALLQRGAASRPADASKSKQQQRKG